MNSYVRLTFLGMAFALLGQQAQASRFLTVSPGCQVVELTPGTTAESWSGACRSGFVEGEGVLRTKQCDARGCAYAADVAVFRAGKPVGMSLTYMGNSSATTDKVMLVSYGRDGSELDSIVAADRRIPQTTASLFYQAKLLALLNSAVDPNLGEGGLTLNEILSYWEAWNTNAGSGPPVQIDPSALKASATAAWLREREVRMKDADQKQVEWLARREARRDERARIEAAQQAQNLALAQRHQCRTDQHNVH